MAKIDKTASDTVDVPQETVAEQESVVEVKPAIKTDGVVDAWIQDLIGNIPHLRTTEAYNTLRIAADNLKSKLR